MDHIFRFAETGSLMEFSPRFKVAVSKKRTWRRSEISAFSVRSRSRLNRKIAMLQHGQLPLFVTLTYHLEIPQNFEGYKNHLDHFFIRLLQKYPKAGVIWKLEYQWRGYAHFHLFVWNVGLDDLRAFVPRVWSGIAGYGSDDHLRWHEGTLGNGNEHCVQAVRSWNGVKSYASKYFAKVENDKVGGRVWGIRGSHQEHVGERNGKPVYKKVSNVPFSKILEFTCSLDVALRFREAVQRRLNFDFQRLGFWCSNYEVEWLLFFDELWHSEWVASHPPDDPPFWEDDLFFEDFHEEIIL